MGGASGHSGTLALFQPHRFRMTLTQIEKHAAELNWRNIAISLIERICTASRGMVTEAGTSESGCTPARDPLPMPLCSCMAVFIVRFSKLPN